MVFYCVASKDLLLSLFRAASSCPDLFLTTDKGVCSGRMEWSITGVGKEVLCRQKNGKLVNGSITVDASGVLLLLSAVLNSSDACVITAMRQRMTIEAVCSFVYYMHLMSFMHNT